MKLNKLKIRDIKDIRPNMEIEANNWMLVDGNKIAVYDMEQKEIKEEKINEASEKEKQLLEEFLAKKATSWQEFIDKYQIRTGNHFLHDTEGMLSIKKTEEKFFETSTSQYLKKLFNNFFEKSDLLNTKFKKNKRAYLLYSDPGMGKSALIRNFCDYVLETDGTAVITVNGDINFGFLSNIFLKDYASDVKRIILVIEDFGRKDATINATTYNPSCLNFLDGTSGLFRVPTMILCTTNFAKQLGPQLTNRPGRFNKLIKVLPPTDDEIFELVEGISEIKLTEEQKRAFKGKNMSPDHVIEAIVRHEIDDISIEQSVHEVMSEREGMVEWN